MDKGCSVEEESSGSGSTNQRNGKGGMSSELSPLAESLFLSPPSNVGPHFGLGKLVRCTSTPSYSSLFSQLDAKDSLFTSNIQLDHDDYETKRQTRVNNIKDQQIYDRNQDSAIDSYQFGNSTLGDSHSGASSLSSSRGKYMPIEIRPLPIWMLDTWGTIYLFF